MRVNIIIHIRIQPAIVNGIAPALIPPDVANVKIRPVVIQQTKIVITIRLITRSIVIQAII